MDQLEQKKVDTIREVKRKLNIYSLIMKNGHMTMLERIPSFTTSVLKIPEKYSIYPNLGKKVCKAIADENSEHQLIEEYTNIIESLEPKNRNLIIDVYFNDCKVFKTTVKKQLKQAYELIACMDSQIDFTYEELIKSALK